MRVLTGDAIDNILDLMNDKDFRLELETLFKEACQESSPVKINEIYLNKLTFEPEFLRVKMTVDMHVKYDNENTTFIFLIDTDYNGEPL